MNIASQLHASRAHNPSVVGAFEPDNVPAKGTGK